MDKFTFTGSQEHTATIEAPATIYHSGDSNVMVALMLDGIPFDVGNIASGGSLDIATSGEYKLIAPNNCGESVSYISSEEKSTEPVIIDTQDFCIAG